MCRNNIFPDLTTLLNYDNEYSVLQPIPTNDGDSKCIMNQKYVASPKSSNALLPSPQNRLGNESNQNHATLENQNCEKFMSCF